VDSDEFADREMHSVGTNLPTPFCQFQVGKLVDVAYEFKCMIYAVASDTCDMLLLARGLTTLQSQCEWLINLYRRRNEPKPMDIIIYALCEPKTQEVRYIGKTNQLNLLQQTDELFGRIFFRRATHGSQSRFGSSRLLQEASNIPMAQNVCNSASKRSLRSDQTRIISRVWRCQTGFSRILHLDLGVCADACEDEAKDTNGVNPMKV
jgi:hypothetical protein